MPLRGSGDTAGRAAALRSVIESGSVFNRMYNDAFVLMQYFGFLKRNPNEGNDTNFVGYNFWLDVLNNREPNNYHGMVCSFITSTEYQLRFGAAVTRSNADCQ